MSTISSASTPQWNALERIGFKLTFIYSLLYIIIQNNGAFPFWHAIIRKPTEWLHQFIPWLGNLVFDVEVTVFTGGSGDTTYDYLISFVLLIVAVLGATIWSILDKNKLDYTRLYYWLSVAVRFYVGLMLIHYGLVKVIKLQFSYPTFHRLLQAYGDSSPMGLAWTFLGFSKGYNLFMGIAEVLAGLLLFRRTLTLGAIITLMAAANVMAVNYFYDVPVKLLSTHLVLFTVFLLSRDIKKLLTFFLTSSPVSLVPIQQPVFKKEWLKKALLGFKILLLGYIFIDGVLGAMRNEFIYGEKAPKPALYGLYKVTEFVKNDEIIPSNIDDEKRWEYIVMERKARVQVNFLNKKRMGFQSSVDTIKQKIYLTSYGEDSENYILDYEKKDSVLNVKTIFNGDTLQIKTKRLTKDDFLLTNRGFNWISERPFNR